jgi:hypothetical protein
VSRSKEEQERLEIDWFKTVEREEGVTLGSKMLFHHQHGETTMQ